MNDVCLANYTGIYSRTKKQKNVFLKINFGVLLLHPNTGSSFFMPPPTEGGAGGIMFSGCPSVRPSRLLVNAISQELIEISTSNLIIVCTTIGRRTD